MLTALEHIGVRTKNIEQAISFYQQSFGFSLSKRFSNSSRKLEIAIMKRDDLQIELLEYGLEKEKIYPTEGVVNHIAFISPRLEADFQAIQENGWKTYSAAPVIAPSGRRFIFFEGPQGEKLQILEVAGEGGSSGGNEGELPCFSKSTFEHIGLRITDLKCSVKFYTEELGFEKTRAMKSADNLKQIQFIKGYGVELELVQSSGDVAPIPEGIVNHIAFLVDDIEQFMALLKEKNIPLLHHTPQLSLTGRKIAYFLGPDGEKIEVIQPL
ncbi:MAG: VOC family protein [Dethiobacter sp.]|jgi:lactoylglutathione lyase|nr:VOC family protein [Dethiobacter sp.]